MTDYDSKIFKQWRKERNKAAKSYDIDKFRAFYEKWANKGFYQIPLPSNDRVIEITMRKIVYNIQSSTLQEKRDAKAWLLAHGCDTLI